MYIIHLVFLFSFILVNEANDTCIVLRDTFAESTSLFTSCAVSYSRPISFCQNCVEYYLYLIESYENMTMFKENGSRCIDKFIHHDRLEVVETVYKNTLNIWEDAKCDKCFAFDNGKLTLNLSVEATTFKRLYNSLKICINRTDINQTKICTNCLNDYYILNDYYYSIASINENISTCMDIVDQINNTWIYWSKNCCKYRRHDETIYLISSLLVIFLTFLFYVVVTFCGDKTPPTILEQRRFVASLSQSNVGIQ